MTPETLSPGQQNPARILVIKLRHHGDMLLITPLVNALKQQYPAARVDVLLYAETRDMLAANPEINQIYAIDRSWKKQGKRHQLKMEWQLIRSLRQQRYDMVLNLADQWPSAIISKLTGAPTRIGFDFPKRRHPFWRYCHTALASTQQHNQLHTVQQNLSILAPLGLEINDAPARMGYSESDWAYSRALLPDGFQENYIVIQPTSRWFFKCWREERMSALINALSAEGYAVVLTSGPDAKEKQMVENIISGCPQARLHSLAGQLTLRQLAAVIDHARLFIGVDSVPMHMAAALGTPLVALFGPSKLTFWRPWQAKGEVIWAGDFGPLPDPDDINTNTEERYLDLIPTDAVIAAAKKVLA
ncbi:TPA: putative lipopolysaccharide heptosyltransferase III [Klebsiella aerogenes]|uniref:putative lipopolysaccharide heptosyltransferase III n=1 Tax=Klebsiella TaxID=570 RepID=UPI000B40EDE9|nr:putative lipopolysaccharide heptosyltransferase III [Klebsiella aerogenes]ELA2275725.1 putative lipopolysaccharide heptosyltransferase III [Klebsiella aerogenes]MDA3993534.1 putative lipopolysaccharide heptosyltransferase III [Klebsiella aerogenes]MDQ8579335.1 putative lipopolysaccharide heptosyltransferase III [Klebsiella aerogenes]MEB7637955.1 putative lipopolysaccharide heptosyltransferase III [Klebsiella aerogenes]RNT27093.1 putative lipopolysaccharide heptosyltransferase III [Klebsiell